MLSPAELQGRADIEVEATYKRDVALAAAERAGYESLVASTPATVRWLLCGRGQPVDDCSTDYVVVLRRGAAYALHRDIEGPRVLAEERLEELGLEPVPFPWHDGPERTVAEVVTGAEAVSDTELESDLAPLRRTLLDSERARYRAAATATTEALTEALGALRPEQSELDAGADLAARIRRRGLVPHVVLVAGEERQPVHRHPLPTEARLGSNALLAVTAERDGLFVSLTRVVSFAPPPPSLARLARAVAEVDAAVLRASVPGARLGDLLEVLAAAYAERGFPEEWRLHHQGGLTGYRGREVFATPDDPTLLPGSCALAWNPSITGGAKSEDTVLVGPDGLDVITATPDLPAYEIDGIRRPAIVEL